MGRKGRKGLRRETQRVQLPLQQVYFDKMHNLRNVIVNLLTYCTIVAQRVI